MAVVVFPEVDEREKREVFLVEFERAEFFAFFQVADFQRFEEERRFEVERRNFVERRVREDGAFAAVFRRRRRERRFRQPFRRDGAGRREFFETGERPTEELARVAVADRGDLVDVTPQTAKVAFDSATAKDASADNAARAVFQLAVDDFVETGADRNAEQTRILDRRPGQRNDALRWKRSLDEERADRDRVLVTDRPNDFPETAGVERRDMRPGQAGRVRAGERNRFDVRNRFDGGDKVGGILRVAEADPKFFPANSAQNAQPVNEIFARRFDDRLRIRRVRVGVAIVDEKRRRNRVDFRDSAERTRSKRRPKPGFDERFANFRRAKLGQGVRLELLERDRLLCRVARRDVDNNRAESAFFAAVDRRDDARRRSDELDARVLLVLKKRLTEQNFFADFDENRRLHPDVIGPRYRDAFDAFLFGRARLIRRSGHPQVEPFGYFDVFHRLATPFLYDWKKFPRTISPFRRRNAPPRRPTLKNPRRKRYKSGRLDRKRGKRRRSTTNRASRRKLDQTTRETVWGIERPKLTVYPPKFKRYFRLVQQAPRKLLPFRVFFSFSTPPQTTDFAYFTQTAYFSTVPAAAPRDKFSASFETVFRMPLDSPRRRRRPRLVKTNAYLF